MRQKAVYLVLFAAGSVACGPALAQSQDLAANGAATPAPSSGASGAATATVDVDFQVFQPDFFQQFNPQTALDMVRRLPGFVFDEGSSARGFGGTAGNVLIDGARPTSKSGGLEEALSRIPASQVETIEVQRGAIGAGEAAGQSVVANVIRVKNASSGTFRAQLRQFGEESVQPSLSGSYSTRLIGWDTTIQFDSFLKDEHRDAVITNRDASGTVTRIRTEHRLEINRDASMSFDAGRDAFGGRLQLNGRLGFDSWYGDTEWLGRGTGPVDAEPVDRFFDDHNFEEWSGELGVDFSRTNSAGWRLRLIGLTTFEDWTATDDIETDEPVGTILEVRHFRAEERSTETIFRSTVGKTTGAFMPEFGVEGAINTLNGSLQIRNEDGDGNETFFLPANPVKVTEKRAEAFANIVWQASDKLAVNGGLNFEISRISTEGAADQAQTFKFLKPSIGITYTVTPKLQLGLAAERSVGQLDFGDFAASADAADDRVLAGNPDLRPDRTDRLQATLDYQYGERGALSLEIFHEWNDDVLERIILPSGGQGRANVGSAVIYGVEANASIPTDRLFKGGLFEIELLAQESSFDDPLTGSSRRVHDFVPFEYFVDFRHDIPGTRWSWGVEYDSSFNWHGYFINEFEDFEGSPRWNAYIETAQFWNSRIRFSAFHIGGIERDRIRNLYDPTRGDAFIGTEVHARKRPFGMRLEISGQF